VTMTEQRSVNHNLVAVEKALQSGLTAVAVGDHYLVPSRTTPGRMYSPRVLYTTMGVVITCDCQAGHTQAPAGSTPCWHGALAMVQEQAEDRARFDGRVWTAGGKPPELVHRGWRDPRPKCPVCDLAMDPDVIIPVQRQVVTDADGIAHHKGCTRTAQ
jgi:hypothetical protein